MITPSKLTPVSRFVAAFGMLPSSYKEAMTYEEQLLWLCNYLEKEILPAINNNADGLAELQNLFVELKNYVDNYFDNLDIQAEVSAKIDEMVESGELQEIITAYLQVKGVLGFDTVADMKAGTNFIDGSIARTLGQLLYKDGKGAFYKIRDLKNTDVIDEVNIIALTEFPDLVAELIKPLSDEKIATLENTRAKIFDTMTAAAAASDIANTPYIQTKGYYEVGDNGGGLYQITDTSVNDISIEITSGVYATLIPQNNEINIVQLGAKQDRVADDTEIIQKAIDFIHDNYTPTNFTASQLILNGNSKVSKITATLEFPHNLRVQGLYVMMFEGTYKQNYAMYVNVADDGTNWNVEYPRENLGYFEDVQIWNNTDNNYNGILNGSNNTFNRLNMDKLDKFFRTTSNYVDSVAITNSHFTQKMDTTNYGISLGYLGDKLNFSNNIVQAYYPTHTYDNAIDFGSASNPSIIQNNIINGVLHFGSGLYNLSNLHCERGQIICEGSTISMKEIFIYQRPNSAVRLLNYTRATIDGLRVRYKLDTIDYTDYTDVDVAIDNYSQAYITNSYKHIVGTSITGHNQSGLKTSIKDYPATSLVIKYDNQKLVQNAGYPFNDVSLNDGIVSDATNLNPWRELSGTYYYRIVKVADFERQVAYNSYTKKFSLDLTNGQGGMRIISTARNKKWRIYRGTSQDTYDKYVDIYLLSGDILDDGITCNGYKWKDRTEGDIDTFNSQRNYMPTNYTADDNIIVGLAAAPTVGTWTYNDRYDTTSSTYRCTAGNVAGGTWLQI